MRDRTAHLGSCVTRIFSPGTKRQWSNARLVRVEFRPFQGYRSSNVANGGKRSLARAVATSWPRQEAPPRQWLV